MGLRYVNTTGWSIEQIIDLGTTCDRPGEDVSPRAVTGDNDDDRRLVMDFPDGSSYLYYDIPENLWHAIRRAKTGKACIFNRCIRRGPYEFVQLNPPSRA